MTGLSSSFAPVIVAAHETLDEAFPDVDPNYLPLGSLVCLQMMLAKKEVGEKRLQLPDEVVATIQQNTQIAKVISCGSLAFCNRNTGQPWPEGAWVRPGDYVRTPRFGGAGDRWEIRYKGGVIQFLAIPDLQIGGKVPRPLEVITYV